jgi:hypothetical protein
MYKLFSLIFRGYLPKWNIIEQRNIASHPSGRLIGVMYVLQEEHTGRIKFKRFNSDVIPAIAVSNVPECY